ncbi:protein G12 [Culex quinquefasciatus]|uniref:protein G12 n=1 Tax=Culex quinquefasciatus TaxID=7176 RepID=UPI0018E3E655|nr:protein G12 [Culex quinquefasciatus]
MKIFLVVAALAVLVNATNPDHRGLPEDLRDFLALVPVDQIVELTSDYYQHDAEFQYAFHYLQGHEFATVWDQLFALDEIRDLLQYLNHGGLDVYSVLNRIAEALGLSQLKPVRVLVESGRTGGLNGFLDDVRALLPEQQIMDLYEQKMGSSEEFTALTDRLRHADFQELVELYKNSKEVQSLFNELRQHGIEVDKIVRLVADFFGWGLTL